VGDFVLLNPGLAGGLWFLVFARVPNNFAWVGCYPHIFVFYY
jgi:hypothetical protein